MKQISLLILWLTVLCIVAPVNAVLGAAEAELRQTILDLHSPDPEVSQRAKLQLLRSENFVNVPKNSAEILKAITNVMSEEDAVLLGAVDLPPDRKQAVLNSPYTPDKVRARLGDKKARDGVIARFENAASLVALRKAALDLLYVNDAESLEAFAKRLESKQVFEDPHGNKISVTALLIQAYGQTYPEEKLFSVTTYLSHGNVSPEEFRSAAHQNYLREIEKYFKDRHQLDLHLSPPLLLDTGKTGVLRQKTTH